MKIKRFTNINEDYNRDNKYYVFIVPSHEDTYMGSIWDRPRRPWISDNAKLMTEFEVPDRWKYTVVDQKELDEINEIKEKRRIEKESKKFNI